MAFKRIHPGELDRTVTLYSSTSAQDSLGQPVKTWTSQGSVPARVRESFGGEGEKGSEMVEDQPVLVLIRHNSSLGTDWKLEYDSETFRIVSKREIGRRHWMELKCVKMGDSESGA